MIKLVSLCEPIRGTVYGSIVVLVNLLIRGLIENIGLKGFLSERRMMTRTSNCRNV